MLCWYLFLKAISADFPVFWQLVVDYVFDSHLRSLLDNFDFYIMPCVNPDGYDYTHAKVYVVK